MRFLLSLAFLFPLLGGSSYGQELIGLEPGNGEIFSIDLHGGQATQIGSTSVNKHLWLWEALARDSSNRLLGGYHYLNAGNGTEIYEIVPSTGQCTMIAAISLESVLGLAFGPGDVLYALNLRVRGAPGPYDLHSVDLLTGTTSLIGEVGFNGLGSLAYGEGSLWSYSADAGLIRIDPTTGIGTDVNPPFRGPTDFKESICFSDHGALYQIDSGLMIQDILTGVPSYVGPLNISGYLGSVEYLPGSSSPFTLGTLGQTNGPMGLQVWGATPLATVVILMAKGAGGPSSVPAGKPCSGTLIDLNATLAPLVILRANAAGRANYGPVFVPAAAARTTHLQALDLASCATSNPAQIIY